MCKYSYILSFLFFVNISFSQDTIYKIGKDDNRFCFVDSKNNKVSKPFGINKILFITNNFASKKELKELELITLKTKNNKKKQIVFAISGAPFVVAGLFTGLMSYVLSSTSTEAYDKKFSRDMASFAISSTALGVGLEFVSIMNGVNKKKRLKKTIKLYNSYLN